VFVSEFQLRLPFSIFKMRTDGTLHFVEEAQSLDDARARVQKLAQLWPGEYIISKSGNGRASLHYRTSQTGLRKVGSSLCSS